MFAHSQLNNMCVSISYHGLVRSQDRSNLAQYFTADREREIRELQQKKEELEHKNRELQRQKEVLKDELQQQHNKYEEHIQDLEQQLHDNVYIQHVSPQRCYATGKGLEVAMVGEQTTLVMHAVDIDGRECNKPLSNIDCELISEATGVVVGCKIERKISQYEVSYQPTHRGQHQLSIRVEGVHIRGSPFTVVVKTPVHLRQRDLLWVSSVMLLIVLVTLTSVKFPTPIRNPIGIIYGISIPWGVAVRDNGEIVVVEYGNHCVSVFDHNRKKMRTFGTEGSTKGQFKSPFGVAVDSAGNILVADGWNHRIQKFTAEGKFLKAVGRNGTGHLEFNLPAGIGINHKNKKVYVCDCYNHRIQILNEDLTFSSSFGQIGCGDGEFHYPLAVAFDSTGYAYISGRSNSRIQVFTPEGKFVRKFGKEGSGEGELYYPSSIGIDSNNIVYITDQTNHRVSTFTSQGKFIRSFGTNGTRLGEFDQPCGIAVDKSGQLYVSDAINKRVQIFAHQKS